MTVLDELNPTKEQIKAWAYDENLLLVDQDEDLILENTRYLDILIDFTFDNNCLKRDYCISIIESLIHNKLVNRDVEELKRIDKSINSLDQITEQIWLVELKEKFNKKFKIILEPTQLDYWQCREIAFDLNIGSYEIKGIDEKRTFGNGVIEFKSVHSAFDQFFYINPNNGNWKLSKFKPLNNFA